MVRKKKSGGPNTLRGGSSSDQKNEPDNDAIWGACREALDAAAERKAQEADRLKSAARELGGFTPTETGRWMQICPHCGRKVELYSDNSGVRVVGYGSDSTCRAVPSIGQWLRDEGFQS